MRVLAVHTVMRRSMTAWCWRVRCSSSRARSAKRARSSGMKAVVGAVLLTIARVCAADPTEQAVQRALIERDQQSAEFAARLQGRSLDALHARQFAEPASQFPDYDRSRMTQEREAVLQLPPPWSGCRESRKRRYRSRGAASRGRSRSAAKPRQIAGSPGQRAPPPRCCGHPLRRTRAAPRAYRCAEAVASPGHEPARHVGPDEVATALT